MSVSVVARHATLACLSSSTSMCRVFFIPPMLPYLDGYISHIAWTLFGTVVSLEFPSLSNKPLQRTVAFGARR